MAERDVVIDDLMERLGFCPCGQPEKSLKLIRDVLRYLKWRSELYDEKKEREAFLEAIEESKTRWDSEFPLEGFEDFVMHWLDVGGYLEHGGSVLTGWLEAEGEDLLTRLEALELDDE